MHDLKLWMIVLGGKPEGRNIEQHDVMFAVGSSIADCYPSIKKFWPIQGVHIDSYMRIDQVDGYRVQLFNHQITAQDLKMYFINLGGYLPHDLEEYHKKIVVVANNVLEAKQKVKADCFFQQGLQEKQAYPHVDDQKELGPMDLDDCMDIHSQLDKVWITLNEDPSARYSNNPVTIGYLPIR